MKKFSFRFAICVLTIILCVTTASAATLIPGGQVIGLALTDNTVTVAAIDETLGAPARSAGLEAGDCLLRIDNVRINSVEDVQKALRRSDGQISLTVRRGDKTKTLRLSPALTADGPKLGVFLRQGTTGLGTVTYYDPDTGKFGALGHGVSDRSGGLVEMISGKVYGAAVSSVRKGAVGKPGQLMGSVTGDVATGQLSKNTQQGVFGTLETPCKGDALPVATAAEIQTGAATIRSTVGDALQEYSVEILKIYPNSSGRTRNMLLKVTDSRLLAATGGIVQGMSGSPIIQNGKLVGAVTHVLVNDPQTGYGIFIENMLEAAS